MDKLFFNGEFTSKGNFRGEDVYKFLKDLKLKMELQEVPEVGKVGFLHRHLSVTAKTIVGSTIKDFDEAASKLIQVYGKVSLIITRMLIEAEEKITPLWRGLAQCQFNERLGERVLVFQTLLSFLDKLKEMSERGKDFEVNIFNSTVVKRIHRLVPVKVRNDFIRYCFENKIKLEWTDGSHYMGLGKFIQEEYRVTLETLRNSVVPEVDLRNDVVEQSKRNAAEGTGEDTDENLEESMSESESCKSPSAREEDAVDDDVKESGDIDEKLLKDKESFAYKLRRLRAQLFEENGNGSMSSPSIEKYEKMVKKFVTKFKNYKMPTGVRLLKYEVDLWNKKVVDTKEALASGVKEVENGSTATTRTSELSEEVDAVVTGIKDNASVSLSSSGSVTCSHCGYVRNSESGVEMHDSQVHEGSRRSDDPNEGLRKLIEVEVRRQIWPQEQSANAKKISNAEDVVKLDLPDVPDESIIKSTMQYLLRN